MRYSPNPFFIVSAILAISLDLHPLLLVRPRDPLVIDLPYLTTRQHLQVSISIRNPDCRPITKTHRDRRLIPDLASIPNRTPMECHRFAGLPLADPVRLHSISSKQAPARRLHHFLTHVLEHLALPALGPPRSSSSSGSPPRAASIAEVRHPLARVPPLPPVEGLLRHPKHPARLRHRSTSFRLPWGKGKRYPRKPLLYRPLPAYKPGMAGWKYEPVSV